MAIYSLNLGFISRSEGRSAVGFSAYISASQQQDIRTGVSYNYGCKEDVIVSRILASEDAPDWAKNASTLWNRVEQFEDEFAILRFRGNTRDPDKNQKSLEAREHFLNTTQTAQTIMGALPKEFTQLEAEACVEEFLKARFVSRGLVIQYAIHWDKGNPHFHGLITRRALEDGDFSQRKDRDIVSRPELLVTRKSWEEVANKHLALGGHEVRIDSRSYANQGLDLLPTHHEGWYAQRLAERGEYSRIVFDNDDIRQKNIEILCKNPGALIHEVSLKRTVFTRKHIEDEIIRRVGGDEKLFALLQAKVEGVEVPAELILKQAADNRREGLAPVFEGEFSPALQNLASQFTNLLLENADVVASVGENLNREKVFTSASYKKQEEHTLHLGETLYQRQTKTVSDDLVSKSIERREEELGFALSEEQRLAVTHLCSGFDISILNGKAGTGKTTLLKAVAEAYQEAGYRVLGTSFQGKAVEIMEQEIGISCMTLDSFKYVWEKHQHHKDLIDSGKLWGRPYQYALKVANELEPHRFTSKDVIIVDEANMVGNHLWEVFLNEATEKGAKVLMVQDPAQIKSREPGDTGRLFAEKFGFCETSEVVRQRIPWQRECSKLLNDHHVLDGLKPYYDQGHLRWAEQSEHVLQNLTQDYVKDLTDNPNDTRMALAYRNSEVYALNQSIREILSEQGYLQEHFKIHGEEYAIGDRIRFTQNDNYGRFVQNTCPRGGEDLETMKNQSIGVKNGTFGIIEAFDETQSLLTVCLDSERTVQFSVNDYKHITHGYAMGINKSEGSTFDRSFVSLDPMMDPSTLLVAMTRHRHDVQVFINREQFMDFKAVVDRIGSPSLSQTVQDYQVSEEQRPAFDRVQHYRDLIVEASTLREEMEGDRDFLAPLYKHPSYATYQAFFEEKKGVAEEILKDWPSHEPYVRMLGIRKDVLEVEAGFRPRLLSDLEHRASFQVQGYMDLVNQTRTLWKTISETHPGVLAKPHPLYEDYASSKAERDSIASILQESPRLYSPFFRVTKDEFSGEVTDYWGEKIEDGARVYFAGVKSHAEAHHRSQLQNLFYERLSHEQKANYDEMKAYVSARNEAATIYSHLKKQETASVQVTTPEGISLDQFHEKQTTRDALALKIVESPEKYQTFFAVLKVKEDKLLAHAVTGELREKVQAYAIESDISKRASQAQELKRILTTSSDYRIFKESGLDVHRMTFDMAFHDKLKTGEISSTLHPDEVYKPIQSYLDASKLAASLWKTVQLKGDENTGIKKDWEAALQARNENAKVLGENQSALTVLGGMGQGLQQRVVRQADPTKQFFSVDSLLEASRGRIPEITSEILGAPNRHLSTKTALRFGNKGSLVVHHSIGFWKDFESGEGGNIIQLIQREKGLSFKDSMTYLGDVLKMNPHSTTKIQPLMSSPRQENISLEDLKDRASRLNGVSELQMKSKPIEGSLAENYLRKERGIQGELASDLRYLPKGTTFMYRGERKTLSHSCLAAFGRVENGSLSSVQLTKLDDQGNRAHTFDGQKLTKIQYGLAKGSFVCLQEDNTHNRVFIAEGVETALSLKEAGLKGTIMASLGILNIANYQGSEKEIILCGDNDDHKKILSSGLTRGSQTHHLLEATKENFQDQGKSVYIVKPSHPGDDFNDVLKKYGIQGVKIYLSPYLDPEKQMRTPQKIPTQDIDTGKQTLGGIGISKSPTTHSTTTTASIDVISDYIQSKMRDIKAYEGTSLAHEAKQELKDYLKTLQKNEPLFQTLKDQNKDLVQEVQKVFQEQMRIRSRGIEM